MVGVRNLLFSLAVLMGCPVHAGVIDQIDCGHGGPRPAMEQSLCRSKPLRGMYQAVQEALHRLQEALPAQAAALADNQAQWERLLLATCASELCLYSKMKERQDALGQRYSEITTAETPTPSARLEGPEPVRAAPAAGPRPSLADSVAQAYAQRDAQAAAQREAQEQAAQAYAREQETLRAANAARERQAREDKAKADALAAQAQARQEAQRIEKEAARKRSDFMVTWATRIALVLLAANLVHAWVARKRHRLVLFSSYTDIALLMGTPVAAFVIAILLAVFGLPDTAAKAVGALLVLGAAGMVLLHTARTNPSAWMAASSFVAKCTLLVIGGLVAVAVFLLLAPGARRKYERHASYERRSSAQTAVALAAGAGAAAYLGHLLCDRQAFVSLEEYLAARGEPTAEAAA